MFIESTADVHGNLIITYAKQTDKEGSSQTDTDIDKSSPKRPVHPDYI